MKTKLILSFLALAVLPALCAPAIAGNGNTLYLLQESPPGTTSGNNFLSDQTLANYSSIGSDSDPARQSGIGNTADVTIRSDCSLHSRHCGDLTFVQDNSGDGLSGALLDAFNLSSQSPNVATVTISGNGSADLQQIGGGNVATLNVHDGYGDISQLGLDNTATLTLGNATKGGILQGGSGNTANMTVNAVGFGGAWLTQGGSNLNSGTITVDTTSVVQIYAFGSALAHP